jgi:hypothetical protein
MKLLAVHQDTALQRIHPHSSMTNVSAHAAAPTKQAMLKALISMGMSVFSWCCND